MSRQLEGDKDAAHHSPSTVTAPCVREHGGGDGTWEPWQGFLIYKSTLFAWSASLIPAHSEGEATGKSPRSLGSARAAPAAWGNVPPAPALVLGVFLCEGPTGLTWPPRVYEHVVRSAGIQGQAVPIGHSEANEWVLLG